MKSATTRLLLNSSQPEKRAEQIIILVSAVAAILASAGPEATGSIIRGSVMAAIDSSHSISDLDKSDLKLLASILLRNLGGPDAVAPISVADRDQVLSMTKLIRAIVKDHLQSIHSVKETTHVRRWQLA